MIVRCGRCGVELEIAGPGEFMCPNCGTRNVARGAAAQAPPPQNPFGVPDLAATAPAEAPAGVQWVHCPSCSYRFAVGELEEVSCPSCSTVIDLRKEDASADQA